MKKNTLFIIIIAGILVFQLCAEGYVSFCEEVKTQEEQCETSMGKYRKDLRQDIQFKGIHDYVFPIFTWSYLNHCGTLAPTACFNTTLTIISKLLNHSPPRFA